MNTKAYSGKEYPVDADGHLADASQWTKELANEIALEEGIDALTDRHWAVIDFMRNDFAENSTPPSLRKITKQSGVQTKEIYDLFPKGPSRKAAKIAGLPKPKGCI